MDKGLSVVLEVGGSYWGAFSAACDGASPQIRCREPPSLRQRPQVGNGSKVAASPSTCSDKKRRRITERLAGRVKGLTARFDVLLVTPSALPPPVRDVRQEPQK
jgi:hypothetical protein